MVALALTAPAARAGDVVEYFHLDAIGNIRVVTDQNKNVIERHDYYPFGEECTTGPCASNPGVGFGQPRKFTGKERDAETGLDYFGARYYGAKIGRFTTVDPLYTWNENLLDPQRWNRYSYVRNNPLRYVDPDGRGTVKHIFKLIAKGGDVASTFKGVADDAAVLFSADPTVGTGVRLLAAASLTSELLPVSGRDVKEGAEFAAKRIAREGEFSIFDWSGYPESLAKPSGPFRLLEGQEYEAARGAANQANRGLHKADPSLAGKQIHEIQPVKFGGNPTDPANKLALSRQEHAQATTWWNRLLRDVKDK